MNSLDVTHTERTEGIRTLAAEETAKVAGAAAFLQGDLVASQPARAIGSNVPGGALANWEKCTIGISGCGG